MRKREDVEKDSTRTDILALEVLLDIRDLLLKATVPPKRRGRPPKKIK